LNELIKELESAAKPKVAAIKASLLHDLREATPVDTGKARDAWEMEGNRIINKADYIVELNAGSSRQAPAHFIEQTVLSHRNVRPNGLIVTRPS